MQQHHLHLISHLLCPYVQRSIITLQEKSIPYTRTDIDLHHKPAWFTQTSPLGKVPILIVDETHTLFESAVICEYLDEATSHSLHPTDNLEKAYHRAWIEFGSSILSKITSLYNAKDAAQFQIFHTEINQKFQLLEKELKDGPWFAGESFHLIDAVFGPIFRYFDVFDTFTNLHTFDALPKCNQWRRALQHRSSVKKAVSKDYLDRLITFLLARNSYMALLIQEKQVND